MFDEDNKEATKEGFFSNESTVENNLNKNSFTFQTQNPKRVWEVKKAKIVDEKLSNEYDSPTQTSKAQMFIAKIQEISKDEGKSMSKAWKNVYWQTLSLE